MPELLSLGAAVVREIDRCVHCGLCLPDCPTYRELGQEADSPRGRIHLVQAAAEGRLALDEEALVHLDRCLGCLACQTACPSGVGYGVILEGARAATEEGRRRPWWARWLRHLLLRRVLPSPRRLALLARLAGWGNALALPRLAARLHFLPRHLAELAAVIPRATGRPGRRRLPVRQGAGEPRVALVLGCVQDILFADTNVATARVLVAHGCTVVCPPEQVCCGALHAHAGDHGTAMELARRNLEAFDAVGVELVVANAAGCGAHLKGYGELLAGDPANAERARAFAARVRDFTEVVATLRQGGRCPVLACAGNEGPVVFQDPCHLAHGQGVRQPPRDLLAAIPGLDRRELADDACCGSAGFYNLLQPELAAAALARKVAQIEASGARVVATANPGCLLQLRQGLRQAGSSARVVHLADLLAGALLGPAQDMREGSGQPWRAARQGEGCDG